MNGYESMQEWLSNLKQLTPNEFLTAEKDAEKFVLKDLGKPPTKDDYKREQDNFNPIFVMILIIGIAGLIISSFEVFKFVGIDLNQTISSTDEFQYGIPINKELFVGLSQLSYLVLAELSMISFIIAWRFDESRKERNNYYKKYGKRKREWILKQFDKYFSFKLALALMSMSFILLANWSSGLHPLLALMPAFITIGVGYQFEESYTKWFLEKERVDKEYNIDTNLYQEIKRDPTTHPEFDVIMKRSIWNRLNVKNRKSIEVDVDREWKYYAVQREIENSDWAKYTGNVIQARNAHEGIDSSSSEVSVLRTMMDDYVEGANPEIRTANYIVNMKNLTFHDLTTGADVERNSIAGLKKYVTSLVKD